MYCREMIGQQVTKSEKALIKAEIENRKLHLLAIHNS